MNEFRLHVSVEVFDYMAGSVTTNKQIQLADHLGGSICGKYAIVIWADSTDTHLKVLDVSLADQVRA